MQFYSETLGDYLQAYEFQMFNTFETVKFNVDAQCDIPRLNMDPKLLFTNHRQSYPKKSNILVSKSWITSEQK